MTHAYEKDNADLDPHALYRAWGSDLAFVLRALDLGWSPPAAAPAPAEP